MFVSYEYTREEIKISSLNYSVSSECIKTNDISVFDLKGGIKDIIGKINFDVSRNDDSSWSSYIVGVAMEVAMDTIKGYLKSFLMRLVDNIQWEMKDSFSEFIESLLFRTTAISSEDTVVQGLINTYFTNYIEKDINHFLQEIKNVNTKNQYLSIFLFEYRKDVDNFFEDYGITNPVIINALKELDCTSILIELLVVVLSAIKNNSLDFQKVTINYFKTAQNNQEKLNLYLKTYFPTAEPKEGGRKRKSKPFSRKLNKRTCKQIQKKKRRKSIHKRVIHKKYRSHKKKRCIYK